MTTSYSKFETFEEFEIKRGFTKSEQSKLVNFLRDEMGVEWRELSDAIGNWRTSPLDSVGCEIGEYTYLIRDDFSVSMRNIISDCLCATDDLICDKTSELPVLEQLENLFTKDQLKEISEGRLQVEMDENLIKELQKSSFSLICTFALQYIRSLCIDTNNLLIPLPEAPVNLFQAMKGGIQINQALMISSIIEANTGAYSFKNGFEVCKEYRKEAMDVQKSL